MARRPKQRARRTGRSLNLVLWFSFSAFALVLVVVFMAVQSLLVGRQYRSRAVESLRGAAEEIGAVLDDAEDADSVAVLRAVQGVAESYGVSFRYLYPDGRSVFSDGSESYPELAEELKQRFSAGDGTVVISEEETLAYAVLRRGDGQTRFLYVSSSLVRLDNLEKVLRWLTLATALFSVVLAFVASGFVAMLITKPVTEVTEQAKELARGKFDLNFHKTYFCSEISELSEALDYARREISKADSMQKELIANVSHDFKTPLTMIKAYASMILEISGDDKQKRDTHARIIIDEADRLTALVGDVLDLSKLRAGVGLQAPVIFNLSEVVYKILGRFDYLREMHGYTFTSEIDDDCYAYADRARIEQVVYNLIGNAVNYTGEDKLVRIRLHRSEEGFRFEVEDTGKGISEEEQATIWDRYYRSSETHKRPVQGTGLGLSIVKGILETQGCRYGVRSEEGKGSTFWVEFPLPPEDLALSGEKRSKGR